jgi:hypothetical protein
MDVRLAVDWLAEWDVAPGIIIYSMYTCKLFRLQVQPSLSGTFISPICTDGI